MVIQKYNWNMKKYIYYTSAMLLLSFTGCEQQIYEDVNYNITLEIGRAHV